ncbi:diacylglycerol/lipid kinase family protein [Caldalkalibacillus salinus]|uniref:diacylglycerol/lipid kinase family protein n=1 Tax=Caldalkalibacillus salinus TaxID=2803787 RepID=UPI001923FDD8|nr:diacylglycerol kinase family protein [Caldalkalibacillus salinus]
MDKKMIVFIINPAAGHGKSLRVWGKVKLACESHNVHYRTFFTKHPGHAEDIAKQIAELHKEKLESVIVVGGDGTVHEVVNGLQPHAQIPVGYIPAGSGNDFARGFSLPSTPKGAIQHLFQTAGKRGKPLDIGRFAFEHLGERRKSRHFVNGVGIGFDGEVAKATNHASYKKWLNMVKLGGLAYAVSAMRLLYHYEPTDIVIELDGVKQTYDDVWLIAVTNIPYYGGGIKITPGARVDDGLLNVCIVHKLNRWKLLPIFGAALVGQHHRFNEVNLLEGRHVRIESLRPLTVHADGEVIGQTPLHVEIHEKGQLIY